jgi:hypothetical protein
MKMSSASRKDQISRQQQVQKVDLFCPCRIHSSQSIASALKSKRAWCPTSSSFFEQSGVKSVLRFDPVTAGKRGVIDRGGDSDRYRRRERARKKEVEGRSRKYLAYSPSRRSDWLQVTCVNALYDDYGYASNIAVLFVAGTGSSMVLPHRMADWGGRRNFVVLCRCVWGFVSRKYVSHISCESFLYAVAVFAKLLSTPIPFHRLRASTSSC